MFIENQFIQSIFDSENIEFRGFIPIEHCKIISETKFSRLPENTKNVMVFLIPYYTGDVKRNISHYAIGRDYHYIIKELFSVLISKLEKHFEGYSFVGCSDVSPIDEVNAASACGLGVIGDNRLLINSKYSSFVFIAQIYTDLPSNEIGFVSDSYNLSFCEHCGACSRACPSPDNCLSAITQKKGELTEQETDLIRRCGYVWGCDECQISCPHSKGVSVTPIKACKEELLPIISSKTILEMPKDVFMQRAYSWRGIKTILRNLKIFENKSGE